MHFAIGTTNKQKSDAIEHVLSTSPYTSGATFSNHKVASGVSDMPTSLEEMRTGAKNRAVYCRREKPDADYFVGMEGGVYKDYESGIYWLLGIVYIENQNGEGHFGYSCHLEVPEVVVDGLFDGRGRDLEQVVHSLGGEENIGDKQGSFHVWTDGMLTRKEQFVMATQCAITPFFNRFYRK
ncbi:MAG: inosine/xanthosine triphosphatase [Candidatus Gracilibacteria bacterium]|nr:inosine/xanthosine triphosphatase [Candidatus Gracilibacteria bacterium]